MCVMETQWKEYRSRKVEIGDNTFRSEYPGPLYASLGCIESQRKKKYKRSDMAEGEKNYRFHIKRFGL